MTNNKNSIRIPFTIDEHNTILKLSADSHLKKTTFITSKLLKNFEKFSDQNKYGINLKFDANTKAIEINSPVYLSVTIEMKIYEKIKKVSDITNISVPQFCRYLLIAELYRED